MTQSIETITINGEEYVKKSSLCESRAQHTNTDGLQCVLARGDRSGVYVGYLLEEKEREIILVDARWIWYWSGAATLAQLAQEGVKNPNDCKFPMLIPKMKMKDCIQIIPVSKKAKKSIDGVPIWKRK